MEKEGGFESQRKLDESIAILWGRKVVLGVRGSWMSPMPSNGEERWFWELDSVG